MNTTRGPPEWRTLVMLGAQALEGIAVAQAHRTASPMRSRLSIGGDARVIVRMLFDNQIEIRINPIRHKRCRQLVNAAMPARYVPIVRACTGPVGRGNRAPVGARGKRAGILWQPWASTVDSTCHGSAVQCAHPVLSGSSQ